LVVRTSGFIETSVSYFYNQYAADKASPKIRSFLEARLETPGNLRMDRIMRLAQEFSGDWSQEIESHADFDRIRAAINSVVAQRNLLAHGDELCMVSEELRECCRCVLELLEPPCEVCDRYGRVERLSRRPQPVL